MGRSKYKVREDGIHVTSKTYKNFGASKFTGRKFFYGKTDLAVDEKIAEFEEEQNRIELVQGTLFKTIAEEWWKEKEPTIAYNSMNRYEHDYHLWVEKFGDVPINQIKPRDLSIYMKNFTNLSVQSLATMKCVAKMIFDVAVLNGDIEYNPCLSMPRVAGKKRKTRVAASSSDIDIIEREKESSMLGRFFYTLLYTGMRKNECVGLREGDIDRENKTLTVQRSVYFKGDKAYTKSPKTESGYRVISLTDNVLDIIPVGKSKNSYVFFPEGLPNKYEFEYSLIKYRKDHGIECTQHQLRHSYASILHSAGIDAKDAQHLLGHSSVRVTQDVYTHLEDGYKKDVQSKLNAYLTERLKK